MSEIDFKSSTHPKHYLIHKYWGRKAHNLIEHIILTNSKVGDLVLDPYLGSGVSVIEANKAGRVGIGYDLNPISALITQVTLKPVSATKLISEGKEILKNMPAELRSLSETDCPVCEQPAHYINLVWENSLLTRIKVSCDVHGVVRADARKSDIAKSEQARKLISTKAFSETYKVPDPELFSFVRRSGVKTLRGLFSFRNIAQIAYLDSAIQAVEDLDIRDALRLSFTSMLPNVSKMIPADPIQVTGKSGWQISKFWVPKVHTEKDVASSFLARLIKVAAGIAEMDEFRTTAAFSTYTQSSDKLSQVKDESVKLIIADPPYGDSIAYLGLSMFWNAWLDIDVAYESEVIIDSSRGKGTDDYANRLLIAFQEMRRVIAPDGKLVVTFNNRHMKYWKPLIQSIFVAGFDLLKVEWIDQAVRSGTQGINHQNTLHGDFVYTYKPSNPRTKSATSISGARVVQQTVLELLEKRARVTSAELYVALIPKLVRAMAFLDDDGKELDIDFEVAKYCKYVKQESLSDLKSGWILKD